MVEAKITDVAEPISRSFCRLICQYQRWLRSKERRKNGFFHYNLFSIITHGHEARVGTIRCTDFDFLIGWTYFPKEYKTVTFHQKRTAGSNDLRNAQQGNLGGHSEHYIHFMEIKKRCGSELWHDYNQYRAVGKIIRNLREGTNRKRKGGVVCATRKRKEFDNGVSYP